MTDRQRIAIDNQTQDPIHGYVVKTARGLLRLPYTVQGVSFPIGYVKKPQDATHFPSEREAGRAMDANARFIARDAHIAQFTIR